MTKKVVLITGGTSGVGKAIAKSFNDSPIDLTIVGRNESKAQQAAQELQEYLPQADVSYLLGDLADQTDNNRLATAFMHDHPQLDVLFNCAGNIPKTTAENISLNLQSHYWFTQNLTPVLKQSPDARVFIITGMPLAIQRGPIYEHQFTLVDRGLWLLTHKTLLVMLLATELQPLGIAVNALFPGDIQSNLSSWTKTLGKTALPIAAQLATLAQYHGLTGRFFDDHGNLISLNKHKYNVEKARTVLKPYLRREM
ncbi:SDR family NAD(P)-dependent oxidoreductase [Furfurilactobacillus entadae]|uniref:SDR family NAD(P)-dependent oxidoreductase n=1 Tax=Furfurilactobacillus entadae TaxID=2922307 RepID=UPI0035EB34D0